MESIAEEAAVLGLEPGETDPVRIILAAQLRLRCCRQVHSATGDRPAGPEVRRIIAARAFGQKVRRTCVQGRVLHARVVATLHRALPADMAFSLGFRGSRTAHHIRALDSERMELLLCKQRWHADSHGSTL